MVVDSEVDVDVVDEVVDDVVVDGVEDDVVVGADVVVLVEVDGGGVLWTEDDAVDAVVVFVVLVETVIGIVEDDVVVDDVLVVAGEFGLMVTVDMNVIEVDVALEVFAIVVDACSEVVVSVLAVLVVALLVMVDDADWFVALGAVSIAGLCTPALMVYMPAPTASNAITSTVASTMACAMCCRL